LKSKANINQLIARCKKQEWSAQKELYLLYADDMMSVAIRYTTDLSAAKDLVQETFLTFFNKIDQVDNSKGALGGWLRRVLINIYLSQHRKKSKISFSEEGILSDHVSKETSAIESLEAEDILKLLEKLPEGCRVIFNLKVIEGYNHQEIGEMLEITASASRSQLTRAKKLLRDMIAKENHSISI